MNSYNFDDVKRYKEDRMVEPQKHKYFTLAGSLQSLHSSVGGFTSKHGSGLKIFWSFFVYGLILAHFAWATYYFVEETDNKLQHDMCDGYGFLMILNIFISFGMLYSWIIKPYLMGPFRAAVWKPSKKMIKWFFGIRFMRLAAYLLVLAAAVVYLIVDTNDNRRRLVPLIGLVSFLVFGFICCKHPGQINWHPIIWGLILQFVFGLLTIRWDTGRAIFRCAGDKATTFLGYATNGSAFVYGEKLVYVDQVFAFQAIASIYFLNFMINILYYYGIMQNVVGSIGQFLQAVMGTSICESVNSAANIFLGQSEAPLLLKPYLKDLTASEIHSIITSGFATVSGTVLAAYISFGASAAHLITASVMSAPAALCYSKLMYPETEEILATKETIKVAKSEYRSVLDAASQGASQATAIVLNIIASLIAFIAFIYFVNGVLEWMGNLVGYYDTDVIWSLDTAVGYIFMPISYVMGVPWDECRDVGRLIGVKMMVNEFAAFAQFKEMALTPRTKVIATYAIVGFANPGSIGLMISAMGALVPEKSHIVTNVVFRAYIGGSIVCFMTACIAALLIPEDMIDI